MANQSQVLLNKTTKDHGINVNYGKMCNLNKSRSFRWKSANIAQKLVLREIRGTLQKNPHDLSSKLFSKLPRRLVFRLRELVDQSVLEAGHVFLGFTKDGQFVLSYTLQLEADENTIYPCYIYKLQWWQFVPYQPLKKVSEVRLFGDENITQDLFVAVCEWPTDYSKVLVYGCSRILLRLQALNESLEETLGECYLTITAVPRRGCKHTQSNLDEFNNPPNSCCLYHSLTIHTKYSTVPPFPQFCPKVCLKIDGTVVINTGDYIIVLTINVGSGLYSEMNSGKGSDQIHSTELFDSPFSNTQAHNENHDRTLIADSENAEIKFKSGFESLNLNFTELYSEEQILKITEHGFQLLDRAESGKLSTEGLLAGNKYMEKYEFSKISSNPNSPLAGVRIFDRSDNARVMDSENLLSDWTEHHNPNQKNDPSNGGGTDIKNLKWDHKCSSDSSCHCERVEDEAIKENLSPYLSADKQSPLFLQCLTESSRTLKRNMLLSPTLPSSSEESSATDASDILMMSGTQPCVTKSMHIFVDIPEETESNETEDDSSGTTGYHNFLPVQVHGRGYKNLISISKTKQHKYKDSMYVCVWQLNLDVEQYVHEVAYTLCAGAGKKYIAFNDYDVQVIDICPDTSEALIMILVLLQATTDTSCRAMTKVFETGVKFLWNITTGEYKTVDVKDLVEVEQKGTSKQKISSRCWNPALAECQELQKQLFTPAAPLQSIHVLTNAAVLKGSSLKILVDPNNYLAIAL